MWRPTSACARSPPSVCRGTATPTSLSTATRSTSRWPSTRAGTPRASTTWPTDEVMRERGPPRAAARPQRHPHPRQDRAPAQALLGGPARHAGHGRRAQQLGRARRGDAAASGRRPSAAWCGGTSTTRRSSRGCSSTRPGVSSRRTADQEEAVPARDAGLGGLAGGDGQGAGPHAPGRGQLAVLRRGHVKTDLNTWHAYLPGWKWREQARRGGGRDLPGLGLELRGRPDAGRGAHAQQRVRQRLGLRGLAPGDVDWSFDYHAMIDEFRRHPKVAGWLYTEHHDVINEWNGYVRADRSAKQTGLGDLVPGMTLRDLARALLRGGGVLPDRGGPAGRNRVGAALGLLSHRRLAGARAHAEARARRPRRPRPVPGVVEGGADRCSSRPGRRGRSSRSWSRCPPGARSPSCAHAWRTRRGAFSSGTSPPSWWAKEYRPGTRPWWRKGAGSACSGQPRQPGRRRGGACGLGRRWTAASRTEPARASSSTASPGRRA